MVCNEKGKVKIPRFSIDVIFQHRVAYSQFYSRFQNLNSTNAYADILANIIDDEKSMFSSKQEKFLIAVFFWYHRPSSKRTMNPTMVYRVTMESTNLIFYICTTITLPAIKEFLKDCKIRYIKTWIKLTRILEH